MRKFLLFLFLTALPCAMSAAWNTDSKSFPVSSYGELRPENLHAAISAQNNNFVCWTRQDETGEHTDLYLQIIDSEGNMKLTESGKRMNTADGPSYVSSGVSVITTSTGNALMIFGDGRATAESFTVLPYVYAVNAEGETVGDTEGSAIAAGADAATNYGLYDIDGHYFARYDSNEPGTYNAFSYVMALDETGKALWEASVKLGGGNAELVATDGGFIAVTKSSNVLSAMKYDYDGKAVWEKATEIYPKVSMWGEIPAYSDGNGGVLVAYEFTDEEWNSHYPLARVSADGTLTAELLKSVSPEDGWNVSSSEIVPLTDGRFMLFSVVRNGYVGNFFLKCTVYNADGTPAVESGSLDLCDTQIAPKVTDAFVAPDGNIIVEYEKPLDYTATTIMASAITPSQEKAWELMLTDAPGTSQYCLTHEGNHFVTFYVEAPDNTVGVRGLRATTGGEFASSSYDVEITVTEAGTLEALLPEDIDNMHSMKISGPLNGTDVKTLMMIALKTDAFTGTTGCIDDFNFKNASFVEGGESYGSYYDMDLWDFVELKTENDVFPASVFESCDLVHIVFPENTKTIGRRALYDCAHIAEINIPAGVDSIGSEAFAGTAITEITLPENLRSAGSYMLYSTNLESLSLPASLTVIPEGFVQGTFLKEIDLKGQVTEIGLNAFKDCAYLESVTGYYAIETIKNYAFFNCLSLGEAPVSDRTASIGTEAFANCSALTQIVVPASTTYIGSRAFTNCGSMEEISVADGNTEYSSADGILYDKNMTTVICCPSGRSAEVIVPEGVTAIGNNGFEACTKLAAIELPASAASVGNEAFKLCVGLLKLTCKATVPPSVGWDDPFWGIDFDACQLIVPAQSSEAYAAADGWKQFAKNITSSIDSVNVSADAGQRRWVGTDGRTYERQPSEGIYIEYVPGRQPKKVVLH